MRDLTAQNQALAAIKIPDLTLDNRMSTSTRYQKSIHFHDLYIADPPVALARTKSNRICTNTLVRHTPTQSLETLSIGPCRARAIFSSESVIIPDLAPSRSRATEFSWTYRSQNLKLLYLNSIEEAFHSNLTTEPRDIHENVKYFLENPPRIFSTICPAVVL